jgi:hypothetical protein
MKFESETQNPNEHREEVQVAAEARKREDLQVHPDMVLTLLEPDQVVVAKQRTRFGARQLTPRHKTILWGLRIYVVVMLVIVLISVIRAIQSAH